MKRYVCELCKGKGQIEYLVENPHYNPHTIYSADYDPATQNEFKSVLIKCPACVAKGYAPVIVARTPEDEQIVQAIKEEVKNADIGQVVSGSSQV